jgi:hypothetical protein
MQPGMQLNTLLSAAGKDKASRLAIFAFINLGLIETLANGLMSPSEVVRVFFNADNCLFVRNHLKDKSADRIMSHGVQLPDLLDALPAEEAQREFLHELGAMRSLCLKLIDRKQLVA